MINVMKPNFNPEYINYKTDFLSEVFIHHININEANKLFIKIDYETYFPSFVYLYATNFVFTYKIILPELADKIFGALELAIPLFIHA